MEKRLKLKLFRFNVERDYLPYFAKMQVKIDEEDSLACLLEIVQKNILEYSYKAYGFKINGVVVFDFKLTIGELVRKFGLEWKIEPLNSSLALYDLVINEEPFLKKMEALEEFGLKREREFLISFLPFAYVTPLSVECEEYCGEVFFILAYFLYQEEENAEILEFISKDYQNVLMALNLETYIFPKYDTINHYLWELKKIVLNKCQTREIQTIKKRLLEHIA